MLRRSFIFVVVLALSAVLGASPVQAGDGATYVIQNGSNRPVAITIGPDWECIEPDLTVGFIGATVTLAPGQSYSKVLWRRDGHGCDGDDAKWSATPTYDGKTYAPQLFRLTGSGGIVRDSGTNDYVSVFNDSPDGSNTNTWQLYMDAPLSDPNLTDRKKDAVLKEFAPEVWLHADEAFGPSSVPFFFGFTQRIERDGKYWLYTRSDINSVGATFDMAQKILRSEPRLRGEGTRAASYGFWSPKAGGYIDLVYFQFFPFNYGKRVETGIYGHHVGDWETMTVRLDTMLHPVEVILSQHDTGETIPWVRMPRSGNHPIVWAAAGSHGLYTNNRAPGCFTYKTTPVGDLEDCMDSGAKWKTTDALVTYEPSTKAALAAGGWPWWLDSANVYRWGNGKTGCGDNDFLEFFGGSGECIQVDGPTGPLDKGAVWEQNVVCQAGGGSNLVRPSMCIGPLVDVVSRGSLLGRYERAKGVQNDWHAGVIRRQGGRLKWVTDAGPWWSLTPDWVNRRLVTGRENPYYDTKNGWTDFQLVVVNGVYQGYMFNGDLYRKVS